MKTIQLLILVFIGTQAIADDLTVTVTNAAGSTPTGSIDLSVSGGVAPFTYNWSGPSGYTSSIEDPSGLEPGNYTVTVTDAYCGTATLVVFVDSTTLNVTENENDLNFNLYPNPSGDIVYIQFDFQLNNAKMEIVNEMGETIYSAELNSNKFQFDSSKLAKGIYFIQVTNKGNYYRKKLVKS